MNRLTFWLSLTLVSFAHAQINPGTPWPATDALNRRVPLQAEVGSPKSDRFVGIFYFLWLRQDIPKSPNWDGPYDVAKILAHDPDALKNPSSPLWGGIGASQGAASSVAAAS